MPNNQGGMSGIEAISGVQAPSSSAVEKSHYKTMIPILHKLTGCTIKRNF